MSATNQIFLISNLFQVQLKIQVVLSRDFLDHFHPFKLLRNIKSIVWELSAGVNILVYTKVMETIFFVFFFLFGLIIGSFLNVVVLRSEKGESLGGRSHCPKCQTLIHWYDNIPVFSYLILRGKCRACQSPISWQYPLVELLTGVVFALVGSFYFAHTTLNMEAVVTTSWYLLLLSLLIAILVSDLRTMEIPLVFLVTGVIGSLFFIGLITILFQADSWAVLGAWWQMKLLGGAVAAFLFWLLVALSKETWMGMGDVWLAGIVGLTVGIGSLLFALTISFFVGAIIGLGLIVFGKKGMQSQVPFAPFLVMGLFLSLLFEWINPWWLYLFLLPF